MEWVSWELLHCGLDSQIFPIGKYPYAVWNSQFYLLVIQCRNVLKLLELMETWATTESFSQWKDFTILL